MTCPTIEWATDHVRLVDQTRLPAELVVREVRAPEEMTRAIQQLVVRGAPAIGVAGAYGVALAAREHGDDAPALDAAVQALRSARPTAVNLMRMVDRAAGRIPEGFDAVLSEAHAIRTEELQASIAMGDRGADLIEKICPGPVRAMTICNTGGLAAIERGTALAVVQTLFERGALIEALPLETRPLLQGARLTAWELQHLGAPFRLLVDSAGPFLLSQGLADVTLVGADRIAANGDTANKIGSYALALGAARAGVPYIVVAPESTIDMGTSCGADIQIEDRGPAEVVTLSGQRTAPEGTDAINPAFDVTPRELITAIVTERRVIRFDQNERL